MSTPQLFVSEIFTSLQGEGPKIGTPSIFLRLGVCNLHCDWCDTPYTWKPEVRDYKILHIHEVAKKIAELRKKTSIANLVITGGEPLLQQQQLLVLLNLPECKDLAIEFETNGSMPLLPYFKKLIQDRNICFNISPKLSDSGNNAYKVHIYPRSVLKFVYVNKKSEKLIEKFLLGNKTAGKNVPVYVMPEGVSVISMRKKYPSLINFCLKRGFTFTPRLQIYLFGSKRGT